MFITLTFNQTVKLGFSQNQTALLLTIWVMTIFGFKISGAHYNPALSFAFMLRKDVGSFPRILAVAYIAAQCFGALCGALISWLLLVPGTSILGVDSSGSVVPRRYGTEIAGSVVASIIAEPLGTFFVAFFYLTQTEAKTVFSKEKAINCFIIAASYVGARAMLAGTENTVSGAVLNPAIGVATCFTMLFDNRVEDFQYVWIYALLPFIGSVAAVLFHEFVFKKTHEVL